MMTLPLPPALPSLPILGNVLDFRRDTEALIRRGYENYGSIFSFRLGPKRVVVLLGADNQRFFFTETDKLLSMREVYTFLVPMFGDNFMFVAELAEYKEQRTILTPAFQSKKMGGYVQAMIRETEDWFEELGESGEFDPEQTFGRLTMFVAARAFMGNKFRQRMGTEFWRLYRDLAGGIEYVLPPNLPLSRFRRRDRARIMLHALMRPVLAERRARPASSDDFLQSLVDAHYSDGRPMPDEVIINLILGLIFAGHETTTHHLTWGLIQLLQHPDYLARVWEEQSVAVNPGSELTLDKLRQLKQLEWALKETERTKPVARLLMRYAAQAFDLGGYHIPRGYFVAIVPACSHRLPELFTQPDLYDPDRFAPGRSEDSKHAFSLVGFGGGLHRCLGIHFAYHAMKVVITLLLQQYDLELVASGAQSSDSRTGQPPPALYRIRYRRRGTTSVQTDTLLDTALKTG
ncbi:MAG: cytochrome P450 [Chloroflexales bacterium]|nr:cytochrome P450 [Chloroflexales bacterium]